MCVSPCLCVFSKKKRLLKENRKQRESVSLCVCLCMYGGVCVRDGGVGVEVIAECTCVFQCVVCAIKNLAKVLIIIIMTKYQPNPACPASLIGLFSDLSAADLVPLHDAV